MRYLPEGHLSRNALTKCSYVIEEISHLQYGPEDTSEVVKRTKQLLQTSVVVQALQTCWDKSSVLKQVTIYIDFII